MIFGTSAGPARRPETMGPGIMPEQDAPHTDYERYHSLVTYTREAEQLGLRSVQIVEHHFTGFGQPSATLNLLSHLAAVTSEMRLVTGVVVPPLKNPFTVAEEAATVDVLSNGRLDLGIGRGYRFNEFNGMNIDLEEATARFDESVEIIERAWTSRERWSHAGQFWSYNDVVLEPEPIQPRAPISVGASNPESIAKIARRGWRLMLDQAGSFDLTEKRVQTFKDTCSEVGRDFDPLHVNASRALRITEKRTPEWEERMRATAQRSESFKKLVFAPGDKRVERPDLLPTGDLFTTVDPEDNSIIGTPDECVERIKHLEAMGIGVITLVGASIEALRLFQKEVLPEFSRAGA